MYHTPKLSITFTAVPFPTGTTEEGLTLVRVVARAFLSTWSESFFLFYPGVFLVLDFCCWWFWGNFCWIFGWIYIQFRFFVVILFDFYSIPRSRTWAGCLSAAALLILLMQVLFNENDFHRLQRFRWFPWTSCIPITKVACLVLSWSLVKFVKKSSRLAKLQVMLNSLSTIDIVAVVSCRAWNLIKSVQLKFFPIKENQYW